jgi:hypothetical protein
MTPDMKAPAANTRFFHTASLAVWLLRQTATVSACAGSLYFKEHSFACGHAAHVDSVDFFTSLTLVQNSTLPTIAWTTLRVDHMPTSAATTIFLSKTPTSQPSGVFRRKTYQKSNRLFGKG